MFPYLFPRNSETGVISSRLSSCSQWDPRFQLGRRERTHLLKLSPVPVPQLAQDRVILLNSCSTSCHNHCLYPSFSGFLSVRVHRGKFPWKIAKEPQKFPLFSHSHLWGGVAWRSPYESLKCKIFIGVKRSLIFHGKNMPHCSLYWTKPLLITVLHSKNGLSFIFIIILQELFECRDLTHQIILLYQKHAEKFRNSVKLQVFSLPFKNLIIKLEVFFYILEEISSYFTGLFI